ncbi:DUF4868 domain-containing protein [Jatrophihabitans telluris]|uniref:DUF4868 domain-containing protein n=1 Tax=Jatrophihabitans telluris TaxID=2038343 RepID=A0ABY4QUP4_9ACTN|nr:Kiwa anti-phage protein KwaB-like domain-containing protein [Jatrophihabitans telluris]UQX87349.1 DUF4868 domain-containing protein [Jatrophihabitans telluris]
MINPTPGAARAALATLAGLGPLGDLGLRMSVLVPGREAELVPHSVALAPEAAAALADIAEASRAQLLDSALIEYSPAMAIPAGYACFVGRSAASALDTTQTAVDSGDADPFDPGQAAASRVRMLALRLDTAGGSSATFYRVAESLLQFERNKVFGLIRQGGRYERLSAADVLLMRATFDVVVVDDIAFFSKKATFERAFGFDDELKRASAETFDRVTVNLRIERFDDLRAACTRNPTMMAKMASIKRSMDSDPDYAAAMSMPRLLAFVRANPAIGIEVVGRGEQARLVFDPSPANRFKLVNLLDDDYLRSVLTKREYEASAKVRALPS